MKKEIKKLIFYTNNCNRDMIMLRVYKFLENFKFIPIMFTNIIIIQYPRNRQMNEIIAMGY